MQNRNDFEEKIIHAKAEINALLAGERAAEQQITLQAAVHLCGRCQSTSAAFKSAKPVNRKERAAFDAEVKAVEETKLRLWAKKSNL